MRPNLPFPSATSNAPLKPGGLLRWKVQLVKDARLLLPFTEVMNIARLTSCFSTRLVGHRQGLPPLLIFPTVLLPGNRLRSMLLTRDPAFPFLSQRLCITEPEATSLTSAEPRALWSLTRAFALLSHSLNFLRLPPTFPRPLPLVQTKLPIPC